MRTTTLRQSGGSIIVSLPKALVEQLGLGPNSPVDVSLEGDRIVLARRKRVGLAARLGQCDFSVAVSDEDEAWLTMPDAGQEIIDAEG
jgi:antitoxin ChpS